MIPRISNYVYNTVNIPELSGGVNKANEMTKIDDNQLSDSVNMWYKDGVVKSRPALSYKYNLPTNYNAFPNGNKFKKDYKIVTIFQETYFCVVEKSGINTVCFAPTDDESNSEELEVEIGNAELDLNITNVLQFKDVVYVFCSNYDANESTPFYIYKILFNKEGNKVTASSEKITVDAVYIPTIATNLGPIDANGDYPESWQKSLSKDGIMYEGYNLIGSYYKVKYSTVTQYEPDTAGEATVDKLIYRLPFSATETKGRKVTVTVVWGAENTATYVVNIDDTSFEYDAYWGTRSDGKGGWWVRVKGDEISFWSEKTNDTTKLCTRSRKYYSQNDMEVIAPCPNSEDNYKKVLNMTFNEWYGGGAEGLYGGIHLFMGGNTEDKHKNLVIWSDINKPLYFSENCYTYVGDSDQAVTAFGKQGESLIVFKEGELYSTKYVSNDITEATSLVDITATDVVFPMTQVHGYIGCDCPNTVQLCRNRLVWLNSDGKVYTLVSANQYNERAVYEVSRNIETELKSIGAQGLKNAASVDWNGHYVLGFDTKMLLMDYNSYGYSSIYSYSKEESSQRNIPWWIWVAPEDVSFKLFLSHQDKLYAICETKTDVGNNTVHRAYISLFDKEKKADVIQKVTGVLNDIYTYKNSEKLIYSMLQTKLFDFSMPTLKKNVPKIEMLLGNNDGIPITVTTITEKSIDEEQTYLINENSETGQAGYFQKSTIRPINRINYRLGLKIETEGKLEVSDLVIQYKRLGG